MRKCGLVAFFGIFLSYGIFFYFYGSFSNEIKSLFPKQLFKNKVFNSTTRANLRKRILSNDELCSSILYRDMDKETTFKRIPDLTTDQDVVETTDRGCPAVIKDYRFQTNKTEFTEEEKDNSIAYSFLVHKDAHQLILLLSAIYSPFNVYCIHIDLKSPQVMVDAVKRVAECFSNVFLATERVNVVYAAFSRLQADINCMKDLLNVPANMYNWKYLINLCGEDFPLTTNLETIQQLQRLEGRNLIGGTAHPNKETLKRTKYVHVIRNNTLKDGLVTQKLFPTKELKFPSPFNITVRKNLAYNIFTRVFLNWVIFESEKAEALLQWSRDTATPDEHYWLMLDALEEAPGRTGRISGFQLARYIVWMTTKNSKCLGYKRHFSCVFGAGDVIKVVQQRKLFANKFDVTYDSLPITCMRSWLDERRTGQNDERNPNKIPVDIP